MGVASRRRLLGRRPAFACMCSRPTRRLPSVLRPPRRAISNADAILDAARETGAEAIHPGYGFLLENPEFAEACEQAGIVFIGPTPEQMRAFGLKHTSARACAAMRGAAGCRDRPAPTTWASAISEATRIGYPVMLKSTAGGGGIGMQLVQRRARHRRRMYERVERLARNNFRNAGHLHREIRRARPSYRGADLRRWQGHGRFARRARLLGAAAQSEGRRGDAGAQSFGRHARGTLGRPPCRLGEDGELRESPAPSSISTTRETNEFYFLEVNTRLQVEHGVTEEVNGVDLVEWMVRQAAGEMPPLDQATIKPKGASIQVRLYAEDPGRDFRPSSGLLTHVAWPKDTRVETWVRERIGGVAVLRSHAGEDHRHRRDARGSFEQAPGCARRDRDRRARDQSRLSPAIVPPGRFRARRDAHAHAADLHLPG